ncbi:metalloregulator ArsR/SmtB family transcription factor [Myxococcota bacterium]|nr:metalloregulator ArsR/SmtB family transcription factor [Myxococcota bacterium]
MDIIQLAKIFKALSNDKRLYLFSEIATRQELNFEDNACVVSNLMGLLKLSPPTISHHLKELTNAGLIFTEKKGKFLIARTNKETLRALEEYVSSLLNG